MGIIIIIIIKILRVLEKMGQNIPLSPEGSGVRSAEMLNPTVCDCPEIVASYLANGTLRVPPMITALSEVSVIPQNSTHTNTHNSDELTGSLAFSDFPSNSCMFIILRPEGQAFSRQKK